MFEDVYALPSIHVYESHAVIASTPVVEFVMVRFSVTVESQPTLFVNTCVAALLDEVYVLPSIHV